jgi:nucleoside-diphosphate-sugar epimerase
MILLTSEGDAGAARRAFAVFGVGLIGSAVVDALAESCPLRRHALGLDWSDGEARQRQLREIERRVTVFDPAAVGILWSAGKAGFEVSESEAQGELEAFRAVLAMAVRLAESPTSPIPTTFGLVSSAGGLFEGQRLVDRSTRPQPLRPYGLLKMQQEEALATGGKHLGSRVYRISSVYGYLGGTRRKGLISTLVRNGLRSEATRITGRMDTLRDFVWCEDVARFIARDLFSAVPRRPASPMVLAAAKPCSIDEVRRVVERTLGRRICVTFGSGSPNRADITFSPQVVAEGWTASDLSCNVRKIYLHALTRGAVSTQPLAP